MNIPKKLDVNIITKEYFDLLCKDTECSIPRVSNGRNGKFDKNILEQEILRADELYNCLTEKGKIKIGRNGYSKGLSRRYFIANYIGVCEGVVEGYFASNNKEILSLDNIDIENEKNFVCKSKINPLLQKLGYEERHIKCNEAINMGRDAEAKIYCQADYQILSNENKLKDRLDKEFLNTAQIIIEAKCEPSETIHKWYVQAVTYARRLCAPYILIANQYKIFLFYSSNNYITKGDLVFECKWEELSDKQKLYELKKFIHRKQFLYDSKTHSYRIKGLMEMNKYYVGTGWWSLLNEAQKKLKRQGVKIIEYKEKYGVLKIYTDITNDEIHKITDDIEKRSSHICEFCGKEGHTVEIKNGLGGWLKTVCSDCSEKDVFELIKK